MERKFYDLNISFDKNFVQRAKKLGLSGICLVANSKENIEDYLEKIKEIKKNETNIDIITGILIDEKADKILKIAKNVRRKVELVLVAGGNYEINRIACSSDYIDILCHPDKGRQDPGIDHICCREAREHDTIIELNFRELLTATGMEKIRELNKMKEIIRLCNKTKAKFIVNSGATNIFELRGGRELCSLSFCLGASLYDSLLANSEIAEKLILKNREKLNKKIAGVENGR